MIDGIFWHLTVGSDNKIFNLINIFNDKYNLQPRSLWTNTVKVLDLGENKNLFI